MYGNASVWKMLTGLFDYFPASPICTRLLDKTRTVTTRLLDKTGTVTTRLLDKTQTLY